MQITSKRKVEKIRNLPIKRFQHQKMLKAAKTVIVKQWGLWKKRVKRVASLPKSIQVMI